MYKIYNLKAAAHVAVRPSVLFTVKLYITFLRCAMICILNIRKYWVY